MKVENWKNLFLNERAQVAREVYEQGEFVVDLDNGNLVRQIGRRKARKYRIRYEQEYRQVFLSSKSFLKKLGKSLRCFFDRETEDQKLARRLNQSVAESRIEVRANFSRGQKKYFANETEESKLKRARARVLAYRRPEVVLTLREGQRKRFANESEEKRAERKKVQKEIQKRSEVNEKRRRKQYTRIENGTHNWNNLAPFDLENEPLERVFDFLLLFIFEADIRYTFKTLVTWDNHSKMHQLDFVSWLLKTNLEMDECYHDESDKETWDKQRDKAFLVTKELEVISRIKQLRVEVELVNIIKEIYDLCNKRREELELYYLPILKYDKRWNEYLRIMQDLLKEFRISRNFKQFSEKKREVDRQWIWLLEETCSVLQTNFVDLVRESFEKNENIDQNRIISLWKREK